MFESIQDEWKVLPKPDRDEMIELARQSWLCGHRGRSFIYSVLFLADGKVFSVFVSATSLRDCQSAVERWSEVNDRDSVRLIEAFIVSRPTENMEARGQVETECIIDLPSVFKEITDEEAARLFPKSPGEPWGAICRTTKKTKTAADAEAEEHEAKLRWMREHPEEARAALEDIRRRRREAEEKAGGAGE